MSEHTRSRVCDRLIHELVARRKMHLCTALKLVGSLDAAEDVLQNTALKCLSGPPRSLPEKPGPYVSRMIRNAAIDYLRKSSREIPVPFEDEAQIARAGTTPLCGQTCLEWKQRLQAAADALTRVAPRKREIFLRHRLAEIPQKQIAQELQVSCALVNVIIKETQETCTRQMETAG